MGTLALEGDPQGCIITFDTKETGAMKKTKGSRRIGTNANSGKFQDINQDRIPNFRSDDDGSLFLVRCFACEPERGRENWAPEVASGRCAWCGWIDVCDGPPEEK